MSTEKTKKKKNRIGKPAPWLFYPAVAVMAIKYKIKYELTVDRSGIKDLKGPALFLCPHVSGSDHILTALTIAPKRPTYVLSNHFWASEKLRPLLKLMHVITKRMYCADGAAVLNIMRAAKEGNIIVLFPEGRLTWYGKSLALTEGTAELTKRLRIPVYSITSDGAGKCFPKWAKLPRRGKISVRTEKLFTPEQLAAMSVDEIKAVLSEKLAHNEETVLTDLPYRAKDLTLGLDGIIWRCPLCGGEKTLETVNGHIKCSCGLDATLDEYGRISGAGEIKTVSEWYEYCENSVDTAEGFRARCRVDGTDAGGYLRKGIGVGLLSVDREKTSFEGKIDGADVSFEVPVKVASAFPISVSDHFDLYYENRLLNFSPLVDPRDAIRFVAYREKANREAAENR